MIALLINVLVFSVWSCEFSPDVKKVYSLSGPVTLALKESDLLKKTQLKAISLFHPIAPNDFDGERLPGGVFLSPGSLAGLTDGIVFFDESQELRRTFKQYPLIKAIEVSSRNLTPTEVEEKVLQLIKPVVRNCPEVRLKSTKKELEKLKKIVLQSQPVLFFLGEIKGDRVPPMLMVRDGVVKWMLDEKLITSYPSELAYVSWSAKIMQSMPKNTLKIGITDSAGKMKKAFTREGQFINLTFPGALVPGKSQVEAMIYLFENLAR